MHDIVITSIRFHSFYRLRYAYKLLLRTSRQPSEFPHPRTHRKKQEVGRRVLAKHLLVDSAIAINPLIGFIALYRPADIQRVACLIGNREKLCLFGVHHMFFVFPERIISRFARGIIDAPISYRLTVLSPDKTS